METGFVAVEKIGGRSTVTRCFSKYPLKFIIPRKVGSSITDAVWIYSLTYGGGIVSVYKSVGSKCSEQVLEARIGSNALLAIIPDPVTCFSTARYSQKQVFRVFSDSCLVIVDWITSGRHATGEKWDFELYKSSNHIFLDDQPLFLDTVLLEQGSVSSIAERMKDYQVIAMLVLLGPTLKHIQNQVQEDVKRMMSEQLRFPSTATGRHRSSDHRLLKPTFIASCSPFGPKGIGVVVRIAATTTESVYSFLRHQLAGMEPLLGVPPYC
eukprot:XP_019078812.1 PREDICTED: urease accessory protein D isoform X3 [Vitis vinifera]